MYHSKLKKPKKISDLPTHFFQPCYRKHNNFTWKPNDGFKSEKLQLWFNISNHHMANNRYKVKHFKVQFLGGSCLSRTIIISIIQFYKYLCFIHLSCNC